MPKQKPKSLLPSKTCPACGLPFTWRRKWKTNWDEVKFCSERCRRQPRRLAKRAEECP